MIESIQIVLSYIIEHEEQDFKENPSPDHVYYHALRAMYGGVRANQAYHSACSVILRRS